MRKNNQQLEELENKLKLQNKRVMKFNQIKSMAVEFPGKLSPQKIVHELVEKGTFAIVDLSFGVRKEKRYIFGSPNPYEVALLLRPNSYFTHRTALYYNDLITTDSNLIYVNQEQPVRERSEDEIDQVTVDNAFRAQQRQSKSLVSYKGKEIHLLNGMNTKQLGVVETNKYEGILIHHTDLERTLIDITVRPGYSGGPTEVLNAYKKGSAGLLIAKFIEYLHKLDYRYPYHQAVGFYLAQTGSFSNEELQPLEQIGMKYDFYLAHGMKKTSYSKEWRIHYPSDLIDVGHQ